MTLSLMVYAVVVSVMLAAGAAIAIRLASSSLRGTRFIWAGAMAGSLLIIAAAPGRDTSGDAAPPARLAGEPAAGSSSLAEAAAPAISITDRMAAAIPAWASPALAGLWLASSALLVTLLALSYRRHRRRIRDAARATLDGTAVRVTEALGPAVVGVWPADIVVPRWLLARPASELHMVVRHERSHVEAGDPALLLAGCVAAALMPWNPAAWYMLSRLRLAIEVDCDLRVLRAGTSPRQYGSLLIELTSLSASGASRVGAPAFACRPSHLERRLVAMTARPSSHRAARLLAAAGVAALTLVGACQADLPTAPEVEAMDAAQVEERVMPLFKLDPANTIYMVDGEVVDRETVMALAAEHIETVEVQRGGATPRLRVTTRAGDARDAVVRAAATAAERAARGEKEWELVAERAKQPFIVRRSDDDAIRASLGGPQGVVELPAKTPLLVIDGVIVNESRFRQLTPAQIEELEVIKGGEARAKYGEGASGGVVQVRTKAKQPFVREGVRLDTTIVYKEKPRTP